MNVNSHQAYYIYFQTKVDGLDETSEDNHRTKAFSTYILTKSFHLQSNVKYVKIEADIFSLQKVVMDTLLQLNRSVNLLFHWIRVKVVEIKLLITIRNRSFSSINVLCEITCRSRYGAVVNPD